MEIRKYWIISLIILICSCSHNKANKITVGPELEQAINVPDSGKILLFVGQDNETIDEYTSSINYPITGFTLYTGVDRELGGMYDDADWGSGRVNMKEMLEKHPDASIAIGLHLGGVVGQNPQIFEQRKSKFHEVIQKFIEHVQTDPLLTNRKIFLRLGYEFEGPWNNYNKNDIIEVFSYCKKQFIAARLDNIALVWQAASHPTLYYTPNIINSWYPGDEYVDWVGISTFYFDPGYDNAWSCAKYVLEKKKPSELYQLFLDFARKHNKPVMISESSPQGMDTKAGTAGCTWGGTRHSESYPKNVQTIGAKKIWELWYKEYFSFIYKNRDVIRSVAYINTNWNEQRMWRCIDGNCPTGYWGDASVQKNELIKTNWLNEISKDIWVR